MHKKMTQSRLAQIADKPLVVRSKEPSLITVSTGGLSSTTQSRLDTESTLRHNESLPIVEQSEHEDVLTPLRAPPPQLPRFSQPPVSIDAIPKATAVEGASASPSRPSLTSSSDSSSDVSKVHLELDKSLKKPATSEPAKAKPMRVRCNVFFLKLGKVDCKTEKFDSEACIDSSWEDENIYKMLIDPKFDEKNKKPDGLKELYEQVKASSVNGANRAQNLKNAMANMKLMSYDPNVFWSPKLYFQNAVDLVKEQVNYRLEIVEKDKTSLKGLISKNFLNKKTKQIAEMFANEMTVRVHESRKVRGVFYERIELHDFPVDFQELSITLTSKMSVDEVRLVANPDEKSVINKDSFMDAEEWSLSENIKTVERDIYDQWLKFNRSAVSVSCLILRKPAFVFYNSYVLLFLVTAIGLIPFSFGVTTWQSTRVICTVQLMLCALNLRWNFSQGLPSVDYVTLLDVYSYGAMFFLCAACGWHAFVGTYTSGFSMKERLWTDGLFFILFLAFFIGFNMIYMVWFGTVYFLNRKKQIDFKNESFADNDAAATDLKQKL